MEYYKINKEVMQNVLALLAHATFKEVPFGQVTSVIMSLQKSELVEEEKVNKKIK